MNTREILDLTKIFIQQLSDVFIMPVTEALVLANAMDWAEQEGIRFVWFMEDAYGRTHNGLSVLDKTGKVLYDDICGFEDSNDKLLMEAFAAHVAMFQELELDF